MQLRADKGEGGVRWQNRGPPKENFGKIGFIKKHASQKIGHSLGLFTTSWTPLPKILEKASWTPFLIISWFFQLVSSSADNSVKLWNVSRPRQPDNIIKVPRAPVWKVRYTPFGDGLVTLVLNTLVRRENNLMLWNTHNLMSPVHTFYGHTDMVLEFG